MKYLKTYNKLFENYRINPIVISSDEDWSKYNTTVNRLIIKYGIKKWPTLFQNLKDLFCSNNQISELTKLPNSLIELSCNNNSLTKLPELPNKLKYLACINNKLTEIPKLPKTLKRLYCENNPLERLPNGITEYLLSYNDTEWIKENVIKWLVNEPSHYQIVKKYLTDVQRKSFEENGPEAFKNMDQFGMFGLKNR